MPHIKANIFYTLSQYIVKQRAYEICVWHQKTQVSLDSAQATLFMVWFKFKFNGNVALVKNISTLQCAVCDCHTQTRYRTSVVFPSPSKTRTHVSTHLVILIAKYKQKGNFQIETIESCLNFQPQSQQARLSADVREPANQSINQYISDI